MDGRPCRSDQPIKLLTSPHDRIESSRPKTRRPISTRFATAPASPSPYSEVHKLIWTSVDRALLLRADRVAALAEAARSDLHAIQNQRSDATFPRRGRRTKSAASSASLSSVLRGVPICARMVRPRDRSRTWLARTATGKSDGNSPALIPSQKRRSTSATPPATASFRNCLTSASSTSGATHTRRHPGADPSAVALSTACLRKPASESRRVGGEKSAFAARAPFASAYALRTRKNIVRLSPKTEYRLGRPTPMPATRSSIVTLS
jgi:hypothetical protein